MQERAADRHLSGASSRTSGTVREGAGSLPDVLLMLLLLCDAQGLLIEEVSAVFKLKPETLKFRLNRGRLMLHDQLAECAAGLVLRRAAA